MPRKRFLRRVLPDDPSLHSHQPDELSRARDAGRHFAKNELPANGAPEFSYYLNYNGLDRYNRQGVTFSFDRATKQFHYDGAAWHEIMQRYPKSPEATEAHKRSEGLANVKTK